MNKNIDIFYEKIKISLKEFKEYPAHFLSILFADITITIVYLYFFNIYSKLTDEILNWTYHDFIVYFFLTLFGAKSIWFYSLNGFNFRLLKGDLNLNLTKPVNPYFFEQTKILNGATIPTMLLLIFAIIISINLGNYSNYFLFFLVVFFGNLFFIAYFNFFISFAFFMKEMNFFLKPFLQLEYNSMKFNPKILSSLSFIFLIIIPCAIHSYFPIEILNSRFDEFIHFFPYILVTFFSFKIGTYFLWKYGLKKYEAFG